MANESVASFEMLGLHDTVLRALKKLDFDEPTAIQRRAIPNMMDGRDVMGIAQTGSGKTGAFLLPIIDRLSAERLPPNPHAPKALILSPTRELAAQIGTALRELGAGSRLFHTVIFGGSSFTQQMKALERGVQIVIATPGRLMDHLRRGTLLLNDVQTLILDEADRMLDMGFIDDVKFIASKLNQHQTVMFSATMGPQISKLASAMLVDEVRIEVSQTNAVATNVDHRLLTVDWKDKRALLKHLLLGEAGNRTIVFTSTKSMADKICEDIRKTGIQCDAIHGDKPQFMRERILRRFRADTIQVLVATDVAARGIDVPDITHVINFDLPNDPEAYVHRVGRTGRAGLHGIAYSIAVHDDGGLLFAIERTIGETIEIDEVHPFHKDIVFDRMSEKNKGRSRGKGKPKHNVRNKIRGKSSSKTHGANKGKTINNSKRKPDSNTKRREPLEDQGVGMRDKPATRDKNAYAKSATKGKKPHRKGPAPAARDHDDLSEQGPKTQRPFGKKKTDSSKKLGPKKSKPSANKISRVKPKHKRGGNSPLKRTK